MNININFYNIHLYLVLFFLLHMDNIHKKYNDMEGWTPAHSIYIAHSPVDDMLPFKYAYDQYRAISNQGQNPLVHMLAVPSMRFVPHGGMNPHFIIAFMGLMMMAFVENPEDMKRFYKTVK